MDITLRSVLHDGRVAAAEQTLTEGIKHFQRAEYAKAEAKAREALDMDRGCREALYLLAHSLICQRHFAEAAPAFAQLQVSYARGNDAAKEAEWNQLLCFRALSADASQEAMYHQILGTILADPAHPYHTRAKKLQIEDEKGRR